MLLAMLVIFALVTHPAGLILLLAAISSALVFGTFTHSIGVLYKSQEGTIANTTDSQTGNAEEGIDVAVPAATTDQVEPLAITVANIKMCCLFSTITDLVVKTYAAGVLKQTINLTAGKQLTWVLGSTYANPFTNDFDTFKVSNADPVKVTNFKARFLLTD
jgi:hypothetical protein